MQSSAQVVLHAYLERMLYRNILIIPSCINTTKLQVAGSILYRRENEHFNPIQCSLCHTPNFP